MGEVIEPNPNTVLDACAVLTLCATTHFHEILADNFIDAYIPNRVCEEAQYIRMITNGAVVLVPIDYELIWRPGVTQIPEIVDDKILETWIGFANDLDDGEALSAAIALHRGFCLVTDDRKAIRLLNSRLES